MQIVGDDFDSQTEVDRVLTPITIHKPDFKGITVDSRYVPREGLMTYVTGSKWLVNYYSQVLDQDTGLTSHQLTRAGFAQSYRLVKELQLRVTSPLTTTQDAVTKVFSLTGEANTVPKMVFNVGDVFLADIGDGQEGLFEVTGADQATVYKNSVFTIGYALVGLTNAEIVADLKAKTVQTLYYRKGFTQYGETAFIDESRMNLLALFESEIAQLVPYYFRRYFDVEHQVMSVPEQSCSIYDPFLTGFIKRFFSVQDAPELLKLRQLNIGLAPSGEVNTFWDALLEPKASWLKIIAKSMALVSTYQFPANSYSNAIRYTGINYCVYPAGNDAPTDFTRHFEFLSSGTAITPSLLTLTEPINNLKNEVLTGRPEAALDVIKPVSPSNEYVLSEAFYTQSEPLSLLEVCMKRHISGEAVDADALKVLVQTVYYWGEVERFYYIPILLILLKKFMTNAS